MTEVTQKPVRIRKSKSLNNGKIFNITMSEKEVDQKNVIVKDTVQFLKGLSIDAEEKYLIKASDKIIKIIKKLHKKSLKKKK